MRLVLSSHAKSDLRDLWVYGEAQFGEAAADAFIDNFFEALAILKAHPEAGQAVSDIDTKTRKFIYEGYWAFYHIEPDMIVVDMVLDSRSDISRTLTAFGL